MIIFCLVDVKTKVSLVSLMPEIRLTKHFSEYRENSKNKKCIAEVTNDLKDVGITDLEIQDR